MRLIKKANEPSLLQNYRRQSNATYEDLDTPVKEQLRLSLITEQSGVCAYCQMKLTIIKIEHHCERSICNGENNHPDKRLDYSNLFAVCLGRNGKPIELHCDTQKAVVSKKRTTILPMKFNPLEVTHIATIRYVPSGTISSTKDVYKKELNVILNLNAKFLREMRREKWKKFFSKSRNKQKVVNFAKMKVLIEKDLAKIDGRFTNHFPGLSEYMLQKFCN